MRSLVVAVALPFLLAACGGSETEQAFRDAAPTAAALSVDVDEAPSSAGRTASLVGPGQPAVDVCHPHLFVRTQLLAGRLNHHVQLALSWVESALRRAPVIASEETYVWQETRAGVEVRFTMTHPSETVYTWNLELRPEDAGEWTSVFRGEIDRAGATGPHQGTGEMTVDLAALHAVFPVLPVDGLVEASFDLAAGHRKLVVEAGGVRWAPLGTPLGDMPGMPEVAPPDARYVYYREPALGGSLEIADRMVFLCPYNPDLAPAEVRLVSRWYRLADGSVHGRSDGRMTEGQLAPDQRLLGVTCHARTLDGTAHEGFWLMKLVQGDEVVDSHVYGGDEACDPAFGPVPAADSTENDFDFDAVDFTDDLPYPFPGM